MPHENREQAEQRAQETGINKEQVTKSDKGYFIAPQGIKSNTAKKIYAKCRADGKDKEYCAKVAWSVEKQVSKE